VSPNRIEINGSGGHAVRCKVRAILKLISQDILLLIALFYRALQPLYLDRIKQLIAEELLHLTQHRVVCCVCWHSYRRLWKPPRQPNCINVV